MGPSGRITHVIGYIGYIELFGTGICRFCIWVELPVQRRLCPIFVKNDGSPDIHECFRGLTGSQQTPGFWGVTAWYQSNGKRLPWELGGCSYKFSPDTSFTAWYQSLGI